MSETSLQIFAATGGRKGVDLLVCVLLLALVAQIAGAWAAGFTGKYRGIASAAGMSLDLQEVKGRLVGRLSAADGRLYALNGARYEAKSGTTPDERSVGGVQGELRLGGNALAVAFFRIEERPLGIQFLFIPVKNDGNPDIAAAKDYSFLAQGLGVPSAKNVVAAPQPSEKIDLLRFIDEYRQWTPLDVARFYSRLSERDKGLLQLYDHASGDIVWRVCSSGPPNEAITQADVDDLLDRQQTTCADLLPLVKKAQAAGYFAEFSRRARFQLEIIRETLLCNRGESAPAQCADVSALGAPLIVNWRDISSIMRELVPQGSAVAAKPQAVQPETVATVQAEAKPTAPKPVAATGVVTLPLRASLAEVPDSTTVVARTRAEIKQEGRIVRTIRRRGLDVPLRNPRF
ncbi:MAG: hypothetical protein Q7S99_08035 [Parvibaculum sp.]|nr:hypothetical protein [Parvibaculum sp.]